MNRILCLALLCLTACEPFVIWQIGDSTAYELGEELPLAAGGSLVVPVGVFPGVSLGLHNDYFIARLGRAVELQLGSPSWVVVQLGSNDFGQSSDPQYAELAAATHSAVDTDAELDAAIASLLEAVPASARILWVIPGPGVQASDRSRLLEALARAPRPIETLELPAEIYRDGIHFGDQHAAAQGIIQRIEALRP